MLNRSIITKVFQVKKKHDIFSGLLGMYQRKKSMRPYCVSMLSLLQLYICCGCFLVLPLLSNWSVYPTEILPLASGGGRERKKRKSVFTCMWEGQIERYGGGREKSSPACGISHRGGLQGGGWAWIRRFVCGESVRRGKVTPGGNLHWAQPIVTRPRMKSITLNTVMQMRDGSPEALGGVHLRFCIREMWLDFPRWVCSGRNSLKSVLTRCCGHIPPQTFLSREEYIMIIYWWYYNTCLCVVLHL